MKFYCFLVTVSSLVISIVMACKGYYDDARFLMILSWLAVIMWQNEQLKERK